RFSPISRCQTAQIFSFPRRMFAPGFCIVASLTPNRGVGGAPIRHPHLLTSPQVAPGHFKVIILLPCVALTPPLGSSGYIMSNWDRSQGITHARLEQAFGLLRTKRSS